LTIEALRQIFIATDPNIGDGYLLKPCVACKCPVYDHYISESSSSTSSSSAAAAASKVDRVSAKVAAQEVEASREAAKKMLEDKLKAETAKHEAARVQKAAADARKKSKQRPFHMDQTDNVTDKSTQANKKWYKKVYLLR